MYIEGVGANGALIAAGGMQRPEAGSRDELVSVRDIYFTFDMLICQITFDHVHLCDDFTENSTWHRQATSGDIPPPRSDFCMVAAPASDNSSYNMYVCSQLSDSVSVLTYEAICMVELT